MRSQKGKPPVGTPIPRGIHSPRLHLELYSILLVATPFIMLRSFMQDAIGRFSASTFSLVGLDVPIVPTIAAAFVLALLVVSRRRITRRIVLAVLLGIAMVALAQRMTDYYFGHRFYELQQNWHYIAYSLFSYMTYRDLRPRGVSLANYMLITFALAAGYSTFDEGFQLFLNNRIFDMSDIGKDIWGVLTGMTVILVGIERPELAGGAWKKIRQAAVVDYFRHVPSIWVLEFVLAFVFLAYSSLLTEFEFVGTILLFSLATWVAFFAVLHFSQFRWPARIMLVLAAVGGLGLGYSYVRHHDDGIVSDRFGLTVYRGIPLPFFDVMIRPDGSFRLVDKKHYFNNRDRVFFNRRGADILLIGSGYRGKGGKGFPHLEGSRFIYNPFAHEGLQVIILNSADACREFNRLRRTGKNVLFILHSTC